jgi:hypothetical protein
VADYYNGFGNFSAKRLPASAVEVSIWMGRTMIRKLLVVSALLGSAVSLQAAEPSAAVRHECEANYLAASWVMLFKSSELSETKETREQFSKLSHEFGMRALTLSGLDKDRGIPAKLQKDSDEIADKVKSGDADAAMDMAQAITACNELLGLPSIGV